MLRSRTLTSFILLFGFLLPASAQNPTPAKPRSPTTQESSAQKKVRLAHSKALSKKISALLRTPDAARAFWGIHVVSLSSGQALYELNADQLFTPASNTKLFTTAAALALLGPVYHERTTVESPAQWGADGALKGDLYLIGRGDPNISGRVMPFHLKTDRQPPHLKLLEELADQVAKQGVKNVEGGIIGDDSFFSFERFGEGWSQDDLMWSDGSPASALTVNDNEIFITVRPGIAAGDKAQITVDPDVPYYEIDNRIHTVAAGTASTDPKPRIGMDRQPGSRTLVLWGAIALGANEEGFGLAVEDPAEYAALAFRAMLEQRGIKVVGQAHARHFLTAELPFSALEPDSKGGGTESPRALRPAATSATVPANMNVLASRNSLPMLDDLIVINKVSQNLHAEIALRLLSAERGAYHSLEEALRVEKIFLAQAGITPEEYVLYDGSGMSRQNLIAPRAATKLLEYIHRQPWAEQFQSTLPVAGVDGTLSDRMKNTSAEGRVFAKTGTLLHVHALSGYAQTLSGETLAFSILCNNHNLHGNSAVAVIDRIVEALVDDAGPSKPAKKSKAKR